MQLKYKIAASIFWLAFCLTAFWDGVSMVLFFCVAFGTSIWHGGWTPQPGETQRGTLLLYGSFAVIFVGLILGFKAFDHLLLSAILTAGMFASLIIGRIRAIANSEAKEPPTPESDTGDT